MLRWRADLQHEIRLHSAVSTTALYLQVVGLTYDLVDSDAFIRRSRHGDDHPLYVALPVTGCVDCDVAERVRSYLERMCFVAMRPLPPECYAYHTLRNVLGVGITPRRRYEPTLQQRLQADSEHDALVVLMYVARRLLAVTHAPGALTDAWRPGFYDDKRATKRIAAMREAVRAAVGDGAPPPPGTRSGGGAEGGW